MCIDFTYLIQPPKKFTFEMEEVRLWAEKFCFGKVLNLFAGKVIVKQGEIRNDINKEMPAEYHFDAIDFIEKWDGENFDSVILDPPYNVRKSREKYKVLESTFFVGKLKIIKDKLPKILNKNANVISFGYDSVGMSKSRGFKKIAICLICHNGDHNDTIGLVEKYTSKQTGLFA